MLSAGVFRIVENGAVELHFTFDSFAQELTSRIGWQSPVFRITAMGSFDAARQTLSALVVSVTLL